MRAGRAGAVLAAASVAATIFFFIVILLFRPYLSPKLALRIEIEAFSSPSFP